MRNISEMCLHPSQRLKQARKLAIDKVKAEIAAQEIDTKAMAVGETNAHSDYHLRRTLKQPRVLIEKDPESPECIKEIGVVTTQHMKSRLKLAKEKARSRIITFEPQKRPMKPVFVSTITTAEQPQQKRNDTRSSGALAAERLREKRREALEKMMRMQSQTERQPR